MEYNKLVRDRIPDIIESQGKKAITCILDPDAYMRCLEQKLDEEVSEYHESGELEELADILEVVFALAEAGGHTKEDLLSAYQTKHEKRGGFARRIFLISKE